MWNIKHLKKPMLGFILALASWGVLIPQGMAQDMAIPTQVVSDYLAGLVSGDTQQLIALIDGRKKKASRQLAVDPGAYSQFLQSYYVGVQTTVEEIVTAGNIIRARVRFDYPTSNSSVIVFILTQIDGQWKITDEEF